MTALNTHRFSLFGYYGQGNAGDEAILAALIVGIKNTYPLADIGVYSARPEDTQARHQVKGLCVFKLNVNAITRNLLKSTRGLFIKSVLHFFKSHTIIIGGGGLFFDTPDTNKWFMEYIHLIHRAKNTGKKVALMGISVGPLHHSRSMQALGEAFNRADFISVRDYPSRKLLIECGVAAERIQVIPDLVFTLPAAPTEAINALLNREHFSLENKPIITLTPCYYNRHKDGWLQQYAALCQALITQLGATLWFVPMQRHGEEDDLTAINAILALLPQALRTHTASLQGHYGASHIQGVIGRSHFVIAERLHGSIMAINQGVPVVAIAYMPKVTGVLELANMEDRLIPMETFLSGAALPKVLAKVQQHFNGERPAPPPLCSIQTAAKANFEHLRVLG